MNIQKGKRMFRRVRKPCTAGVLIILAMLVTLMPVSADCAQQQNKGEWILPENYPFGGLDGWGTINRLTTVDVVIEDAPCALAPSVTYHFLSVSDVSGSCFKPVHLVGFL